MFKLSVLRKKTLRSLCLYSTFAFMKTTNFKNTKISYTDQGKGTAVVLLHGFLENQSMWKAFIPELVKKHRIITIDLLGHGETECLGLSTRWKTKPIWCIMCCTN